MADMQVAHQYAQHSNSVHKLFQYKSRKTRKNKKNRKKNNKFQKKTISNRYTNNYQIHKNSQIFNKIKVNVNDHKRDDNNNNNNNKSGIKRLRSRSKPKKLNKPKRLISQLRNKPNLRSADSDKTNIISNNQKKLKNQKYIYKNQNSNSNPNPHLPQFSCGLRVMCRPSGHLNDKWLYGIINDIIFINSQEYLSIMIEFNNNDQTFAQYFIPTSDPSRVQLIPKANAKAKAKAKTKNEANKILKLCTKTRSNPSPSYSSTQLMSLGLGGDGVFTKYDLNNIEYINNKLLYNNTVIVIPLLSDKLLNKWSALEVSSYILSLDNAIYKPYLSSIILNNVNGKALSSNKLSFVSMMKLTKYQISVNDCTKLLKYIKDLIIENDNIIISNISSTSSQSISSSSSLSPHNNNNNNISRDDIDLALSHDLNNNNNNNNKTLIEIGSFWSIYYIHSSSLIQYVIDKPVNKWTSYDVSKWINHVYFGKFKQYSQYFLSSQINGNLLLNITRKQATNQLRMISPSIRKLFFDELRALSSLAPCNIRNNNHFNSRFSFQNNNNNIINDNKTKQVIRRFTVQFNHNDFSDLKTLLSPKDNSKTNMLKKSKSYSTLIEKQKQNDITIIKGIHSKNPSKNKVIIAGITPKKQKSKDVPMEYINYSSDDNDDDDALSIGPTANMSNTTSLITDQSFKSVISSTQSLSPKTIQSKSINTDRSSKRLEISLQSEHKGAESKTLLIGYHDQNNPQQRTVDDNINNDNLHQSFTQYSSKYRYSDTSRSSKSIIQNKFDVKDEDEKLDIGDDNNNNNIVPLSLNLNSNSSANYDDPNDPLWKESLSPSSKYNINNISNDFISNDNDIDIKTSFDFQHEPNLTLELNDDNNDNDDNMLSDDQIKIDLYDN